MMKVKCLSDKYYTGLTHGKVYDVIEYIHSEKKGFDSITIIDNFNKEYTWYYNNFEDVTDKYRNSVIDGILM